MKVDKLRITTHVSHSPRAILMTLMTRIIVGLIGMMSCLISSSMIPITDSRTMAMSSWFHLEQTQPTL